MTTLFLHVGYPKTASSTLQRHLFARHSDLSYLGKPFSRSLAEVEKSILTLQDAAFDERKADLLNRVRKEVTSAETGTVLISHEGFLRNTRYGRHDLRATAQRLHEVFAGALGPEGRVRIVVTLRKQPDLILSHYAHFVRGKQGEFDQYLEKFFDDLSYDFPSSLFYYDVLDNYASLFGNEQLDIFLFEQLQDDRDRFVEDLSAALHIDAGESLRLLEGKHQKQKDRVSDAYLVKPKRDKKGVVGRLLSPVKAKVSRTPHLLALRPEQEDRLATLYRGSNTRVQARFGLPLERYGYALET